MTSVNRLGQLITEQIDFHEAEIIAFARKMVQTRSENPPGDETAVAEVIKKQAKKWLLPEPEILPIKTKRPNLIFTLDGGGNITEKPDRRTLVLNAHMDTKPIGNIADWEYDPLEAKIISGRLYGRGSTDMKGAIASILSSAMVLSNKGFKLKGRLALVFSADEEAGSLYGARLLVDRRLDADAILIAEPSGVKRDFDSIGIACRGALLGKIIVYGTQMHSSISDQGGCINASIKMSEVLLEFANNLKGRLKYSSHNLYPGGPTINPGVFLSGGIFYGVVPGEASFGFDIRTIPGMNHRYIIKEINDFLNELMKKDKELKAELVLEKPPLDNLLPAEIKRDHDLVKSCLSSSKMVLGFEPELLGVPFSTDAIYYANQLKIPTIPSFGPGLIKLAHAPDEYVELKAIMDAAKIYALAAVNYLGTD